MGGVVGTLTETAADALGLRVGIPVAGGTNDAFASYLGAGLLEPGDAYDPGGSAGGFGVYWHEPVEVAGAFVTPAPLAGLYSVGAAMAATGRALDWFRDADRRRRCQHRAAARGGGRDAPGRRRRRVPAVSGRRALTDLGPDRHRPVRGPDAVARSRSPGPRDHRGERARHPPRRDADAGGRRDRHRDAGLRRPGAERCVEPGEGRRDRLSRARAGRARDRGPGLRRSSARWRSARMPTFARRSGP